ncbi:MAG: hypothetical protein AB1331_01950 [Bacillota bacterium]
MAYNFHLVDREQVYLMPPSLRDWLPEELCDPRSRLARLVAAKARLEKETAEVALVKEAKIGARSVEEEETAKRSGGASPGALTRPQTGKRKRT